MLRKRLGDMDSISLPAWVEEIDFFTISDKLTRKVNFRTNGYSDIASMVVHSQRVDLASLYPGLDGVGRYL